MRKTLPFTISIDRFGQTTHAAREAMLAGLRVAADIHDAQTAIIRSNLARDARDDVRAVMATYRREYSPFPGTPIGSF